MLRHQHRRQHLQGEAESHTVDVLRQPVVLVDLLEAEAAEAVISKV